MSRADDCYCQSGIAYSNCCSPFIESRHTAKTAEQLMRSRYTAYVLGNSAYLLATWYPSKRPDTLILDADIGISWLGLDIKNTLAGGEQDTTGQVEFVARYKKQGRAVRLHENSCFIQESGCWYYLDGELE